MGDKYIQNVHNAPITANARDKSGKVVLTKKFMHYVTEKWSGKVLSTGYEKLSEAEYKQFLETSRTFNHYMNKLHLLVVHDELPEALKTPHQALKDAKQAVKAVQDELVKVKAENEELKKELERLKSKKRDSE